MLLNMRARRHGGRWSLVSYAACSDTHLQACPSKQRKGLMGGDTDAS
jgi:hypothetical protein